MRKRKDKVPKSVLVVLLANLQDETWNIPPIPNEALGSALCELIDQHNKAEKRKCKRRGY